MTRDEFIDGYIKRSGGSGGIIRTSDGFRVGGRRGVALLCACGDALCEGWAMVSADPDMQADHVRFYGIDVELGHERP